MALVSCPECDHQISEQAKSCPNCGFPLPVLESPRIASNNSGISNARSNPKSGPSKLILALISMATVLAVAAVLIIVFFIAKGAFVNDEAPSDGAYNATDYAETHQREESSDSTSETNPIVIDGDFVALGNFKIPYPKDFELNSVTENTAMFTSNDDNCVIGVFSADVSTLTESQIRDFLPAQHNSFMTEGAVKGDITEKAVSFGSFDLSFDLYAEVDTDSLATINMDTTFTDSQYSYTIMFRCYAEADNLGEHSYSFAEFCGSAKYVGGSPRFEFIQ